MKVSLKDNVLTIASSVPVVNMVVKKDEEDRGFCFGMDNDGLVDMNHFFGNVTINDCIAFKAIVSDEVTIDTIKEDLKQELLRASEYEGLAITKADEFTAELERQEAVLEAMFA